MRGGGVVGLEKTGGGKTPRDVELDAANAEIARLGEAVKELAFKLTLLEGKGAGVQGPAELGKLSQSGGDGAPDAIDHPGQGVFASGPVAGPWRR